LVRSACRIRSQQTIEALTCRSLGTNFAEGVIQEVRLVRSRSDCTKRAHVPPRRATGGGISIPYTTPMAAIVSNSNWSSLASGPLRPPDSVPTSRRSARTSRRVSEFATYPAHARTDALVGMQGALGDVEERSRYPQGTVFYQEIVLPFEHVEGLVLVVLAHWTTLTGQTRLRRNGERFGMGSTADDPSGTRSEDFVFSDVLQAK
jgi:hypothetical protein